MQLNESDTSYLWDISEACKDILQFIKDVSFKEFSENKMIRYAVERQILVIDEAAKMLSKQFITSSQHIPWKRIIGLRNILAHDYGEILVERVWLVATAPPTSSRCSSHPPSSRCSASGRNREH